MVLTLLAVVLVLGVSFFAWKAWRVRSLVISSIATPVELQNAGYTPEVVARELADQLQAVIVLATNNASATAFSLGRTGSAIDLGESGRPGSRRSLQIAVPPPSGLEHVSVSYKGVSLTAGALGLKEMLGLVVPIDGEVLASSDSLTLRVRVHNPTGRTVPITIARAFTVGRGQLGIAITNAAQYVAEAISPGVLARYFLRVGNQKKALAAVKECIRQAPSSERSVCYVVWAHLLADNEEFEVARRMLNMASHLDSASSLPHIALGRVLELEGRHGDALRANDRARLASPNSATTFNNLGVNFFNMGKDEDAIRSFREAARLNPEFGLPLTNLGRVLKRQRRYSEAESAFVHAEVAAPTDVQAFSELGDLLRAQGRYGPAIYEYEQGVRLDSAWADLQTRYGWTLWMSGDSVAGRARLERTAAMEPRNVVPLGAWARLLLKGRQYKSALNKVEQAISRDTNYAYNYQTLGSILYALKQYRRADSAFERGARLEPTHAAIRNAHAYALFEAGKDKRAMAEFERATQIDSTCDFCYRDWGYVLLHHHRYDEAIAKLRRAVALNPRYTQAFSYLGDALARTRDSLEAKAAYQHALEVAVSAGDSGEVRERLHRLTPELLLANPERPADRR